jgi:hypothetical protein
MNNQLRLLYNQVPIPVPEGLNTKECDDEATKLQKKLHKGILKNDLKKVVFCINHLGPKVGLEHNIHGYSFLHQAILTRRFQKLNPKSSKKNMKIIYQLLISGADVNLVSHHLQKDNFHETPLSSALKLKDANLTSLLMQFGAERLFRFDMSSSSLIEQTFSKDKEKIFEKAKIQVRYPQTLFIFGIQNPDSVLYRIPKEIIAYILKRGIMRSSNQRLVELAKWMQGSGI